MSREEFIGIAADAVLRAQGFDPKNCPLMRTIRAAADAEAALKAVGAYEMLQSLGRLRWRAEFWLDGEGDSTSMASAILVEAKKHDAPVVAE